MSCAIHMTLNHLHGALARGSRSISKAPARFNRKPREAKLQKDVERYWIGNVDRIVRHLDASKAWDAIARQVRLEHMVQKAISDEDRALLRELLSDLDLYGEAEQTMQEIMESSTITTFEEAAKFALGKLGARGIDFELRNLVLREKLAARTDAAVFATRNNIDTAIETIIQHFYELGSNPYDQKFVRQLQRDLGYQTEAQAKRFALTETGIAAELAQIETYRRNGVAEKQWNITGENTRPSHAAVAGEIIPAYAKFDLEGAKADHPLDPELPASELINCHCWLSPVLDEDFELGANVWDGR
jgi:hypothetical protein